MNRLLSQLKLPITLFALAASCAPAADPGLHEEGEDPFTSDLATLMMFEFDGELVALSSRNAERTIEDQMLYTIGQLNGDRSVGRLDVLEITNIRSTAENGAYRINYHAKLPVAWGRSKTNLPSTYELILPRKMDTTNLTAFATKYNISCADSSDHEIDSGSMWYYYRPRETGCTFDAADVVRMNATSVRSEENTTGKYPEYHKIWEDNALIVVSIFGKYEDGATAATDAGIAAYNRFIAAVRTEFGASAITVPANAPVDPGVGVPDITFEIQRDGRTIRIHALLVDNVRTAGATFDRRYEDLSTEADLIAYNGHAGLGSNVRALARKGRFRAAKYQMFFMNGCDTFAYVDGALAETRAALNPDDPSGTKYMDMLTNARPSFFSANANNDMTLIRALLSYAEPRTYQTIFRSVDTRQVIVVTGEEDNVYYPGYNPGGDDWMGMTEQSSVAKDEEKRYASPEVKAGTYIITLAHDPAAPGGDADLYVRSGAAPTTTQYDCRPYEAGSEEECRVTLVVPSVIHMMVRGYNSGANAYVLTAIKETSTPGGSWQGMRETGAVARSEEKRFETTELAAGRYVFEMTGDGDADLYVKSASAPTTSSYDCRPYASNSTESCTVTLSAAAKVYVMIRGYAATSSFTLVGRTQ